MKNKPTDVGQQTQQLNVSINKQNPSSLSNISSKQLKTTYTQYIAKFDRNINYTKCTSSELDNSLTEMRILLRQLNLMLNKMMDKNYQYLAEKDPLYTPVEKEIQLLTAQVQNTKKLLNNQASQINKINSILAAMEGKQHYEQQLIDQIIQVKNKMPGVYMHTKHSVCDISRNGYVLVNQEQDTSQYLRVNILRGDLERAYQRLRRMQDKYKIVQQKEREMEQKDYEINDRFQKCMQTAKENMMQITTHGTIISFKDKYEMLLKRKEQQEKKNALLGHVSKNNQVTLQKKVGQMKKLLAQYNLKQEDLNNKLNRIEKQTAELLKKSDVLGGLAQKSFAFRYAETLLKGERYEKQGRNAKGNDKNKSYDDYEDDFEDFEYNKSSVKLKQAKKGAKQDILVPLKPALIRRKNENGENKYEKSFSVVQIKQKNKDVSKEPSIFFDNQAQSKAKNIYSLRKSSVNDQKQIVEPKQIKSGKNVESPKIKFWGKDKQEKEKEKEKQKQKKQGNEVKAEKVEYKISKPLMNIKKKNQSNSLMEINEKDRRGMIGKDLEEEMQIQPKFTRLSQKKAENKMNDEYMNYLEEKGRKILGLN